MLRALLHLLDHGGFSPGTPPVGRPLSPCHSRALPVQVQVGKAMGSTETDENWSDELTKKGTKRKRAPPTKGSCPHGVKWRSRCMVCSGCPHGRPRSRCKECGGGSGICGHGRQRSKCKECGGAGICEHGRDRYFCKECGGAGICEHRRQRHRCKECKK